MNIFLNYLTKERVEKVHSTNNFIGLWYAASHETENDDLWARIFTTGDGVDFFYSDHPLEAMQARETF